MMWLTPNHSNFHSNNTHFHNAERSSPLNQTHSTPLFNDIVSNLDIDSEIQSQSLSSSPQSTISSIPLPTFDSLPASKIPRGIPNDIFRFPASAADTSALNSDNMMYTDSWVNDSRFGNKGTVTRGLHNRDSSLSSLGSYGPQSPFSLNTANPQIAVSDSSDGFPSLQLPDEQSYQLVGKAPNAASHDTFYTNYPYSGSAAMPTYSNTYNAAQNSRGERGGLLPPPDFSSGGSSNSRPASVASSVASDSPATPVAPEPSEDERRRKAGLINVPKLDRTMTDIYADELFNPNFNVSSTSPSQPSLTAMSPTHEIFSQRVQAANNQHLSTTQSPMISSVSRGRSPFKQSSPLAPTPSHEFSQAPNNNNNNHNNNTHFNAALQMRERRKAEQDSVQALRPTIAQSMNSSTPQTISPQDALLEFNDTDNTNNFPLFPTSQTGFDASQLSKAASQATNFGSLSLDTSNFDAYTITPQLSAGLQLPQQYPFVSKHRQQPSLPSASNGSFSVSSRVGSSPSISSSASASPQRPEHVGADGGTYTCTYHGCTQRFETPALLQKHKREGHRQAHGLNGLRRPEGPTATYFNTQAGPHKCERINPSTGKPCQTVFSRPYDLTRHEDTIHNARKQKVRCDVCTEEKTFSRADALTRHYRVCHPDLEFPGKHRKRGSAGN